MNKQLTEYEEQCLLVDYLETKHLLFSKIAQETWAKNWGVIMKNKKSGVRKGVPDMLVIMPKNKQENFLLFIEMKRKKNSSVSKEQKQWIQELNKVDNVYCQVCYGFEEAKQLIDKYVR